MHRFGLVISMILGLTLPSSGQDETSDDIIKSEAASFRVETIANDFEVPWAMAFMPDGTALISERDIGRMHILNVATGDKTQVTGLPDMLRSGPVSSGLFDIRLHPDYKDNGWIYIAYGVGAEDNNGLAVDRIKLDGAQIAARERLFETDPYIAGKWHFGGRLVFADGYLYISTGDGYDFSNLAQDVTTHAGKILRIHDDGRIPTDNPFLEARGAKHEIWSYGVRNPQGMTTNPFTGDVWLNEHGPQGGDEINIARKGINYGWPVITYGEEYGGGPIGDGITHKDGMAQPVYYWVPSIAPSGMTFYKGDTFAGWHGNAFVGAMALTHINRLVIEDGRVIHEERLLDDKGWRVRFVEEGPDGFLYFGVDDGMIMRLVPVN
jgi:glucose/arabinose dehydrogenase